MNVLTTLFGGIAVTGLVAAGGAAYTATSTIDQGTKAVGATSQIISGINVDSVVYTVGPSDLTTAVKFHVFQAAATLNTVTATITSGWSASSQAGSGSGSGTGSASVACSKVVASTGIGSDITCTFTSGITNVNHLDIVAS